jgi:hypothetical protein
MKIQVSLSKGNGHKSKSKAKKGPRSTFLSALMRQLSGDIGQTIAEAFVNGNVDKFKKAMTRLAANLAENMENHKAESTSATSPTFIAKAGKSSVSLDVTITGSPDCVSRVTNLLQMIQYNGAVGHSGVFGISWDGDGNDRIELKGLPKMSKDLVKGIEACSSYGAAIEVCGDSNRFYVWNGDFKSKLVYPSIPAVAD